VVARLIVLVLAAALAGFALVARHDARSCHDRGQAFTSLALGLPVEFTAADADGFMDACRGSHPLALGAYVLAASGQLPQALRLSDEAIRREPENFEGWLALSRTLRARGLGDAAGRAQRRALHLNPRYGRTPG
jgi:Tfp pilus assembly protein PilF